MVPCWLNFIHLFCFSFILLREPQGIIACCIPVPPLVRQQVNELHLLVQQAREMPLLKVRLRRVRTVKSPVCKGALVGKKRVTLSAILHVGGNCSSEEEGTHADRKGSSRNIDIWFLLSVVGE